MKRLAWFGNNVALLLVALLLMASTAAAQDYNASLIDIQHTWASIKYETPTAERRDAFKSLLKQSKALHQAHPEKIEALVWTAIVLFNYAGEVGGLQALKMVKQAFHLLQRAEKAEQPSKNSLLYSALGQLYDKVPGWPIAFGDKKKAEAYLRKGLALDPDGLDSNYFMAGFLLRKKDYEQAAAYFRRAIEAPARPQRPVADAGRKADARLLLQQTEK